MTPLDDDLDPMSRDELLPEITDPLPEAPAWPQLLRGCIRYRQSLDTQHPSAPRITREYDR